MIHTYQSEFFQLSVQDRRVHAARAANGAIGDHYRCIAHSIFHLVVIADDLDGVGPGFTIYFNSDDEFITVNGISGTRREIFNRWLVKHLIGLKPEIEKEENN